MVTACELAFLRELGSAGSMLARTSAIHMEPYRPATRWSLSSRLALA
jgi:hypothetical protein